MEQIECDICGGENKPGAECDNFICPNYESNRTMKDTYDNHTCHDNCSRIVCVLRRELTAVTEQLDGLQSGIDYASDQLSKVTEQRDGMRKRIAQLEDLYAKACKNVEELAEIGLDQMDKERSTNRKLSDCRSQRDRLAMALQRLCDALLTGNPRDITELLNKAGDALQSLTTPTQPEQTKL